MPFRRFPEIESATKGGHDGASVWSADMDRADIEIQEMRMLPGTSGTLKAAAIAMVLGIGLPSASAETIGTQCYRDGCFRVRCDDSGRNCVSLNEQTPVDRPHEPREVCRMDTNCHWTEAYGYDPRYDYTFDRDYDRAGINPF
jgi:hypothetical protein